MVVVLGCRVVRVGFRVVLVWVCRLVVGVCLLRWGCCRSLRVGCLVVLVVWGCCLRGVVFRLVGWCRVVLVWCGRVCLVVPVALGVVGLVVRVGLVVLGLGLVAPVLVLVVWVRWVVVGVLVRVVCRWVVGLVVSVIGGCGLVRSFWWRRMRCGGIRSWWLRRCWVMSELGVVGLVGRVSRERTCA
ncbi:hypothetical protein [Austwickia chelonae]|uniref:hypothetical protein n=1 Tax=Austwickia chelonae TaxID=100225 RepID=UPI000E22E27B|nr:hypothetical protein [Austwickia chelonae]